MKHAKRKIIESPVTKLIGFRLLNAGKGKAVCVLRASRKHQNTVGTVHGGILCDVSDAAMGFAFETGLPPEAGGVTVEFKINFLSPAFPLDTLKAVARTVWKGKSLSYLECEIRNQKGALIAKAASTCKRLTGKKREA